jgi:hypothetical protein
VLADAFPAEGAPAFRAARNGLARGMIETTLLGYRHTLTSLLDKLLKNAHLRRYPATSPSRRRGKKSLLIRRDTTPHPSSLRRTFKYASLLRISGAPANGISQSSTCIRAFLISLRKMTFSKGP